MFVSFIIGYLCGSIPFGLILTRLAGLGDVRTIGSGNIGATNVLRTGNKKIAALTLLCDGMKGFLPLVLYIPISGLFSGYTSAVTHMTYSHVFSMDAGLYCMGLGAVIGHMYPVWLGFKGGKGMATAIGVLFGFNWILGLSVCGIWLVVALISKISSLAALIAIGVVPVIHYFIKGGGVFPYGLALIAGLVWWRHRDNIQRLMNGTEPKIGAVS